jgi:hypothetical protein
VPFQLRPSPGRGWGAFATRRLSPGDLIFQERPLVIIKKPFRDIRGIDIEGGFLQLLPDQREQVSLLRNNSTGLFLDYRQLFFQNMLELNLASKPLPRGFSIVLSRFNHSCVPNCRLVVERFATNHLRVLASKSILPKEELTFCYRGCLAHIPARRRIGILGFPCTCPVCHLGTPFQRTSDKRRNRIREMMLLLDGGRFVPIKSFPRKIRRDEEKEPADRLSVRFTACVLLGFLLDGEGLMDDWSFKLLQRHIRFLESSFKRPRMLRSLRTS